MDLQYSEPEDDGDSPFLATLELQAVDDRDREAEDYDVESDGRANLRKGESRQVESKTADTGPGT